MYVHEDERVTVQFLSITDKARASCDGWDQVPSPVKPEYEIHIYIRTISNAKYEIHIYICNIFTSKYEK